MAITATPSAATSSAADRQALIDQINGSKASSTSQSGSSTKGSGTATEQTDRFLKLLVAQMSHQDPLNPLDNAAVTSQMAQISTVEGIGRMNTTLAALTDQTAGLRAVDAAGLIGKSALIGGNALNLNNGAARGAIELNGDATKVVVQVMDKSGTVVRSIDIPGLGKGVQPIDWDGKNDAGQVLADGAYTFRAQTTPSSSEATTLTAARVSAVVGNQTSLRLELAGFGMRAQSDIKGFF